jgi:hypothetical protein
MAKKSKLNGFVFKKLDEINNGLQIPTGNVIKPPYPKAELPREPVYTPHVKEVSKPISKPEVVVSSHEPVYIPSVKQVVAKPISKPKIAVLFNKMEIDSMAFTPMTNIVPTIESKGVPTKRTIVVPTVVKAKNVPTKRTVVMPTVKAKNVPTNRNVVVPSNTKIFKRLSRKAKQRVTHEDLNMAEYGALQTKQDKIVYLSMRGWSLKVEVRGNTLYHYATRYVNRQKKRLYLGSVNS